MEDKYGLIIKYECNLEIKDYKSFFENLIKFDRKVFIPNYVYYSLKSIREFKSKSDDDLLINEELKKSIDMCIKDSINEYIRKNRQEVRNSVRMKNTKGLTRTYLSVIKKFGNKVNSVKTFVNYSKTDELYKNFLNTLFCDPFIHNSKLLSDEIMNIRKHKEVKYLILKIKKISSEFYSSWFLPFLDNCLKEYMDLDISISEIKQNLVPIYKYSMFVNYYNKYRQNFAYISKDKNILDSISSILVKDIISSISKLNKIYDFNVFLKENYKSLNFIGKSLTKEKKEFVELYLANNTNSNINSSVSLEEICDFYITISKYYSITFPTICSLFCKKISQLITQKDLYIELNDLIIKTIKKDCEDCKVLSTESSNVNGEIRLIEDESLKLDKYSSVSCLVDIISNLNNKDIIFKNYHKFLMIRLLNYTKAWTDNKDLSYHQEQLLSRKQFEKKLIGYLSKCFTNSQIYVLKKSILDFYNSYQLRIKFVEAINDYDRMCCRFNPMIISNNIWDLSILSNETVLPSIVDNDRNVKVTKDSLLWMMHKYNSYFLSVFDKSRILNWYLHIGRVEIKYNTMSGTSILILLPIQSLILEQFEESEELTIDEIYQFNFLNNYPQEEIINTMNIFVSNDLLLFDNDIYKLNEKYSKDFLDLRKKYFQISRVLKDSIKNDEIKLCNDRIDIVKSVINSLVKKQKFNKDELYLECCSKISVFELDIDLFEKSLDYLISRDYIKNEDSIYQALFY